MSTDLQVRFGGYAIERVLGAYLVMRVAGNDEVCVARCPFKDESDRKAALHAALRTAKDLSETKRTLAEMGR